MMLPEPAASMRRPASREHRKAPVRLTAMTRSQVSTAMSSAGWRPATPAPFTNTSMRP